jgi:NAD(P)H-dependent FMN reductase
MSTNIAIIIGSTRPGRNGAAVAEWVHTQAQSRTEATYELVDLADFDLPNLDEAVPASFGQYEKEHTKAWAAKIAQFDGFIFVTPEYNHATSGALKNAIDFIYGEWNNKAAGFVGYGSLGAVRAVEGLRVIMAELQVADVRAQVAFTLQEDFENYSVFVPRSHHEAGVGQLFDQIESWSGALKSVRESALASA